MDSILDTPIEFLKGVGPSKGALLRKELSIETYGDLLQHFPHRYIDTKKVHSIKQLDVTLDYVQLRGIIMHVREEGTGFKKRLVAELHDTSGTLELVWFQGIKWVAKNIQPNKAYTIYGKLSFFNGKPSITHPDVSLSNEVNDNNTLMPLYPSTEKLKTMGLNNKSISKLTAALFEKLQPHHFIDSLNNDLKTEYNLCDIFFAYQNIHFPKNDVALASATRRLKWEELFYTQLKIGKLRVVNNKQVSYVFSQVGEFFNNFYNHYLPFELTNAQKRVIKEIREDTRAGKQMNRLIQGDVGSGKTMVAFLSILLAVDNNFQACLMAPTEILAQQHYESFKKFAEDLGLNIALLTGSVKAKEKKQILYGLKNNDVHIVIGTHALIEETVEFANLGLAVIDEQHRFGVGQRAQLWKKNHLPPHILVMTATPIPRTLAMTAYGDLDTSIIDELPPGRKPIQTVHRNESFRPQVMQFIKAEIAKGRQVYIVYPLIEESEKLAYESLEAGFEQVKMWFPTDKYNIAMVHGKQPIDQKERNMQRFISGDAHILVATTVIEVGVNVPNASVMIIESAEKFGLSQLHQLRGRVGRGSEKSYCVLLTSNELSKEARQRMSIMVQTNDGFVIAEEDLKMRGPGDIYGTKQSGALNFKIADIINDAEIIEETRNAAQKILSDDPNLQLKQHQNMRSLLNIKNPKTNTPWNKIS